MDGLWSKSEKKDPEEHENDDQSTQGRRNAFLIVIKGKKESNWDLAPRVVVSKLAACRSETQSLRGRSDS